MSLHHQQKEKCFTDLESREDGIGVGMRDTDTTQSLAAGSRAEDKFFPACMIHSHMYHCMFCSWKRRQDFSLTILRDEPAQGVTGIAFLVHPCKNPLQLLGLAS